MFRTVLGRAIQSPDADHLDVADLARRAIENVAEARSTWTRWHVQAEVQRLTRAVAVAPERRDDPVAAITAQALSGDSLQISAPDLNPAPGALQRRDGESVYSVHGSTRYTYEALILAVEDRLLAANAAQVELVRPFVCDDRLMVAGVGPAGGKTTAMQLTAAALNLDGRPLVAVAPSARAAGPVPVPSGQAVVDVGPVGLRLSDLLLKA